MKTYEETTQSILEKKRAYDKKRTAKFKAAFSCTVLILVVLIPFLYRLTLQKENIYFPETNDFEIMAEFSGDDCDIDALYNRSYGIVVASVSEKVGNIEDSDSKAYAEIKITKVIKGNFSKNQTISILETGTRTDKGNFSIKGVPLLDTNNKVLLFIEQSQKENYYSVINGYYGKFFYDENGLIHASTEFIVNKNHPALDKYSFPISEDEFMNILNSN